MSLYSLKTATEAAGAPAPWSAVLALADAGDNLARLAALYDKRPGQTSRAAPWSCPPRWTAPSMWPASAT